MVSTKLKTVNIKQGSITDAVTAQFSLDLSNHWINQEFSRYSSWVKMSGFFVDLSDQAAALTGAMEDSFQFCKIVFSICMVKDNSSNNSGWCMTPFWNKWCSSDHYWWSIRLHAPYILKPGLDCLHADYLFFLSFFNFLGFFINFNISGSLFAL